MKKLLLKKQGLNKRQKLKKNELIPIQDTGPDELNALVALLCKQINREPGYESERDQMVEKTIALLDDEMRALENNAEPASSLGTFNQTFWGKMAIRMCNGDLKAAKLCLEKGKMPKCSKLKGGH